MRLLAPLFAMLLAGCAATIGQERPLRIVSWNLEHLAAEDDSGCRPRTDSDYRALRAFANELDADVFAFQEVENERAAARVFDPARYDIVVEARQGSVSRPLCRGLDGRYLNRQAVGFAIRRGIAFERKADLEALQLGDPDLRGGVDIEVRPQHGMPIRLLAIHLKSGCAYGETGEACETLFRQIPILEAWIDERARIDTRFVVLGDFNRRLAQPNDRLWLDLDDEDPLSGDLIFAAGIVGARCDPRYREFIDHIVGVRAFADTGFREWTYVGARLSDHCPVSIELRP